MMHGALGEAVGELDALACRESILEVLDAIRVLEAKVSTAIAAFDKAAYWEVEGATSMTAWLREHGRMAGGTAKTIATTATRVAALPETAQAWQDGILSTGQVRAIAANLDDQRTELFAAHEAELVPALAPLSVADTAKAMQVWRSRADDVLDRPEGLDPERRLFVTETLAGRHEVSGSYGSDEGQVLATALRVAATADSDSEVAHCCPTPS